MVQGLAVALALALALAASSSSAQTPPAPDPLQTVGQAPAPPPAGPVYPLAPPLGVPVAEPPHLELPSPTGYFVGGALLAAAGVGNLATAPLCETSGNLKHPTACVGTSIGFGLAFVGASIPLFVIAANRRAAILEATKGFTLAPTRAGASLGWRWTW